MKFLGLLSAHRMNKNRITKYTKNTVSLDTQFRFFPPLKKLNPCASFATSHWSESSLKTQLFLFLYNFSTNNFSACSLDGASMLELPFGKITFLLLYKQIIGFN